MTTTEEPMLSITVGEISSWLDSQFGMLRNALNNRREGGTNAFTTQRSARFNFERLVPHSLDLRVICRFALDTSLLLPPSLSSIFIVTLCQRSDKRIVLGNQLMYRISPTWHRRLM